MGEFDVTLEGGKPWGIRMQGGKGSGVHLKIGQVTPGSKAANAGVQEGLHILSINGADTTNLTMVEAQNLVKQTGDTLTMRLVDKAACPADEEEDFLEDLKKSMGTQGPAPPIPTHNNNAVKGNTFKMLQGHIDAGQTSSILTAWDKPTEDRNKSVPTNAPKVESKEKGYDKSSFGLDDDVHKRQSAFIVHMSGGRPWGFKLQGGRGTGTPLYVASVTPDSKAHVKRLLVGDEVLRINSEDAKQLSMMEAQELIKSTGNDLKLTLIKHGLKNAEQVGPTTGEIETMEQRANAEDDPQFFNTLTNTVDGGKDLHWSGRHKDDPGQKGVGLSWRK